MGVAAQRLQSFDRSALVLPLVVAANSIAIHSVPGAPASLATAGSLGYDRVGEVFRDPKTGQLNPNRQAARPIVAAIALLCAAPAGARQAETMPTVTVLGAAVQEGLGLARENATASRLNLSAQDMPASVESLSAATMQARGDLQVKDAITRSTGLTDTSSP
eukprot:gene44622-59552_t